MEENSINMKNISLIDALPVYNWNKIIMEIGCGNGNLSFLLAQMGYTIYACDLNEYDTWEDTENLTFCRGDIFDLSSMPLKSASVVIASEVLEHLSGWQQALLNMLALAEIRIIITVPYKKSFWCDGHVNFFDDSNIDEFTKICSPYSTAISKILTKPKDKILNQSAYLIVINKRQYLK